MELQVPLLIAGAEDRVRAALARALRDCDGLLIPLMGILFQSF
jgi:hypothetical protein